VLRAVREAGGSVLEIGGGDARNAIPASAKLVIALPSDKVAALRSALKGLTSTMRATEPDAALTLAPTTGGGSQALSPATVASLAALLEATPSGVLAYTDATSREPRLSTNLGVLQQRNGSLELLSMSRSARIEDLTSLSPTFQKLGERWGARESEGNATPGWAPNRDSALLKIFTRQYEAQTGKKAQTLEIHAGLEAGALLEKYPGMDVLSMGPDVLNPHSPQERVSIPSVARTYALLRSVLAELQGKA
jgi:dipeptidase D